MDKTTIKMEKLDVLLVGLDQEQLLAVKEILEAIPELDIEVQVTSEVEEAPRQQVVMAVIEGTDHSTLEELCRRFKKEQRPALFALLLDSSANAVRRALRAGADEVLHLPLDPGETTRALLKTSEARKREQRAGRGLIATLVSASGGVGVTSVTVNLALALRALTGKEIAIVDLDFVSGDGALKLNLEPDHSIFDLGDRHKPLDSIQLESSVLKHPSGVHLLPAPPQIENGEAVTGAQVGEVLDLMRQLFDYVLVDCGGQINERGIAAWERSEKVYYVLDQSIAAIRAAWRLLGLFNRLNLGGVEPALALNKFSKAALISDLKISTTLARAICATIPRDDRLFEKAAVAGLDLWQAGGGAVCHSFEEWGRLHAGISAERSARAPGLLARIFPLAAQV